MRKNAAARIQNNERVKPSVSMSVEFSEFQFQFWLFQVTCDWASACTRSLEGISSLVSEGKLSVMHTLSLGCKNSCQNLLVHPKFTLDVSTK